MSIESSDFTKLNHESLTIAALKNSDLEPPKIMASASRAHKIID